MNTAKTDGFIILWQKNKGKPVVTGICISEKSRLSSKSHFPPAIYNLSKRIKDFLSGKKVFFPLKILDLDRCSPFQHEVLKAVCRIPRGKISTYKLIAKQIGRPKAIRAVALALATNPFPLVIPCHRVIRSNGSIGGYLGGNKMKCFLLGLESASRNKSKKSDFKQ